MMAQLFGALLFYEWTFNNRTETTQELLSFYVLIAKWKSVTFLVMCETVKELIVAY